MQIESPGDAQVALIGLATEANALAGRLAKLREHGQALEQRGGVHRSELRYLKRESAKISDGFKRLNAAADRILKTFETRWGQDHPQVIEFREAVEQLV